MRVIVYGTLKRGGRLHRNMEAIHAHFIREDVLENYEMYNLGSFPAIIEKQGKEVKVEVYEIDKLGLNRLDRIEGYPYLYQRKETKHGLVYYMADSDAVYGAKLIEDGNWEVNK